MQHRLFRRTLTLNMNDWEKIENEFQDRFTTRKIKYDPCLTVVVKVLCGRNISVGKLHDLVDVPDPRVKLRCAAACGKKFFETRIANNQRNPVWNETFTFVLLANISEANIEARVYESDSYWFDPQLGSEAVSLHDLAFDEPKKVVIKLIHGEVDLVFLKQMRNAPDYRLSLGLSDQERQYRIKRKPTTCKALQEFLDEEQAPINSKETPTIALAISGGGYRAVANSCGVIEALVEAKLLDSLMYITGLSGSSWYLSATFLRRALSSRDSVLQHHEWLKQRMKTSLTHYLFDLSFYKRYREYRNWKIRNHQATTFVDLYGLCLGETFLGDDHINSTLSSLQEYTETATVPYPIISCAHVHDYLPMSQYWDEVEMTPHEVSVPGYAIHVRPDQFNSRWNRGILQQKLPALPLHSVMGASGSAFAILWTKLDDKSEVRDSLQQYINRSHAKDKEKGEKQYVLVESDDSDEECPPEYISRAKARNFADAEDRWIDGIEEASGDRKLNTMGRSFLLERTSKVFNIVRHNGSLPKYSFDGELVENREKVAARFQQQVSSEAKNMLLCDSALGCNLPTIHVLRPQRTVDILLIMDCGNYFDKDKLSIELFATVQSQVHDHGIKFPKISIEKILKDPFREFYLFEDRDDPDCPIVLWFTLANKKFRGLSDSKENDKYGDAEDGTSFHDFTIFPEGSEFGTLRLSYTEKNFDRLRGLAKFNVMSNISHIKEIIAKKVAHLKHFCRS